MDLASAFLKQFRIHAAILTLKDFAKLEKAASSMTPEVIMYADLPVANLTLEDIALLEKAVQKKMEYGHVALDKLLFTVSLKNLKN